MKTRVKMEIACESSKPPENDCFPKAPQAFIEISSSGDSDSNGYDNDNSGDEWNNETSGGGFGAGFSKRRRLNDSGVVLPVGFLEPLHPHDKQEEVRLLPPPESDVDGHDSSSGLCVSGRGSNSKQFWKAGEYEGAQCGEWDLASVGMDHVRVHPKFLHSNATSHKWALGAFAELLDNSLDEVYNGATYVNVDMLLNKKDSSRMLLIEDNGGGMDPDKMRHCMSLGYSAKSKQANTIGQYGNGFKTSTMRLGADVIVFSRCHGRDGKSSSQSIGLLSYTFLRSTGKEDIVVPMVDYMRGGGEWKKIIRSSAADWAKNMETIVQWSPFNSEAELLRQFHMMKDHGTRVIIYNLWEDDQGLLELDFDADFHDIQIRGVNRDEKNIQMAQQFPNSRHFLTYRHSLRSYASILYLRLPPGFRIILRGKDVEHHNIVNDMMMSQEITYRPQTGPNATIKDTNMVAVVTIGFVKDAKYHIDVQGFNVYHKNRLIKPFWRLWNAAGSDGRGVIGVLEANFVEPAHDKQGFERTTVLARLEARLIQMQKAYWSSKCHKIGYAPRSKKSIKGSQDGGLSPNYLPATPFFSGKKDFLSKGKGGKFSSHSNKKYGIKGYQLLTNDTKPRKSFSPESSSPSTQDSDIILEKQMNVENVESLNLLSKNYDARDSLSLTRSTSYLKDTRNQHETFGHIDTQTTTQVSSKDGGESSSNFEHALVKLKEENHELKKRLERKEEIVVGELQKDLQDEREKCRDSLCLTRSASYFKDNRNQHETFGHRDTQIITQVSSKDGSESSSNFEHALVKLKEEKHELKKRLERKEEILNGELQKDLQDEREKCRSLEAKLLVAEGKIEELNKEQESLIHIFAEERERRDEEEKNLREKLQEASNTILELLDKVELLGKMKALK